MVGAIFVVLLLMELITVDVLVVLDELYDIVELTLLVTALLIPV